MRICFPPPSLSTSAARRQLDSNQRAVFRPYGFAARRIRPLCHTVSLPARQHRSTSSRIVHSTSALRLQHAGGVKFFIIRYACACMLFVKVRCSSVCRHRRGPPSFLLGQSAVLLGELIEHHIPLSIAAVCQPIGCRRHRKPSTRGVERLRSHSYVRSQR